MNKFLYALAILGFLAACTPPDTYPISGEECGPDDPVQDMSAHDCDLPI
ncbi:hypothetical protein [Nioella aestuarii]